MELKNKILEITNLPADQQDAALEALVSQYSKNELKSSFSNIIDDYCSEAQEIKNNLIKDQLNKLSPIISFSYIAKNYFKKSKGWLSQKINGGIFTDSEIEILNTAIQDISAKIADCKIGSVR